MHGFCYLLYTASYRALSDLLSDEELFSRRFYPGVMGTSLVWHVHDSWELFHSIFGDWR